MGGLTKSVISRVIIRVTPFRVLVTLLITHLLSPLGFQVGTGKKRARFRDRVCKVAAVEYLWSYNGGVVGFRGFRV